MSYELQVYALSPVRPSLRELLGQAAGSGLGLESCCGADGSDSSAWEGLTLRASDDSGAGFTVEASGELARMQEAFRADRADGDDVPEEVLDAAALYVLELAGEADEGGGHDGHDGNDGVTEDVEAAEEARLAAFVVAAWALASLTEGVVFDPQEELFADAESFWALVMDDGTGEEGLPATLRAPTEIEGEA